MTLMSTVIGAVGLMMYIEIRHIHVAFGADCKNNMPVDSDALWETVFDIDAYATLTGQDWVWRGPIVRSLGGSDKIAARAFDLDTLAFVPSGFATHPSRPCLAWAGQDEIFIAIGTNADDCTFAGLPRTIRVWPRGTPLHDASIVHES